MDTIKFTKRIGIININVEYFPLKWVFKILDGFAINKICFIEKCILEEKIVLVVTFKTIEDAMAIYQTCNGIEIEDTQHKFELCVVPEDMIFDDIIETCTTISDFDFDLKKLKKTILNDDYSDRSDSEKSDSDKNEDSEIEENNSLKEKSKEKKRNKLTQ